MPLNIRAAVKSDFEAIAHLQADSWRSAYRNHLPASYLSQRVLSDLLDEWKQCKIRRDDVVLVAEDRNNGDLVGFISVWCRPDPFIDNLHCHPSRTGQGTGALLLHTAIEKLSARGKGSVSLSVLVGNDGARRFYLRHGGRAGKIRRESIYGNPVEVEFIHWSTLAHAKDRL